MRPLPWRCVVLPFWSNSAARSAHVALLAVLILSACSRKDSSSQGGGSAIQTGTNLVTRNQPKAAPEAQPQFGQVGDRTSSRVSTNPESEAGRTAPPLSTDQALSQRVKVALSTGTTGTTGIYAPDTLLDIEVTANNGVLTLQGTVGSEDAKAALEARAKAMDGVRSVDNQLTVGTTARGPGPYPGVPAGRGQKDVIPQQDAVPPGQKQQ